MVTFFTYSFYISAVIIAAFAIIKYFILNPQIKRFGIKITVIGTTLSIALLAAVTYGNLKVLSDIDKEKLGKEPAYLMSYYQYVNTTKIFPLINNEDDIFVKHPLFVEVSPDQKRGIATANERLEPYKRSSYYDSHISTFLIQVGYALVFLLSFIGIFYAWLSVEYRRFNNTYVELISSYVITRPPVTKQDSTTENKNRKIVRELALLLREEYIMFYKLNLAYGKFHFAYLVNPYFYIINICYAFGFDVCLDHWVSAYRKIACANSRSKDEKIIFYLIKKEIEKSYKNNKKDILNCDYRKFIAGFRNSRKLQEA